MKKININLLQNLKSGKHLPGLSLLIAVLLCGMIQGCKSETLKEEPEIPEKPEFTENSKLYLQFNIALPATSSRSQTESDGSSDANPDTFPGEYNENIVDNLYIFFCTEEIVNGETKEECRLLLSLDESIDFNVGESKTRFVRKEITAEQLTFLKDKEKVHVYMIGNMPSGISFSDPDSDDPDHQNLFDAFKATNEYIDPKELGLFVEGGSKIPLSNKSEFVVNFLGIRDADLKILTSGYNPSDETDKTIYFSTVDKIQKILTSQFENRPLELERMYSRIDYAETGNVKDFPHVYRLMNDDNSCPVYVKIETLQPFNVHKQTYLFRHTAEGNNSEAVYDATNGYNVSLFGVENSNSTTTNTYRWVIDVDAEYKKGMSESEIFNSDEADYSYHFYNILTKNTENSFSPIMGSPEFGETSISLIFGENKNQEGYKAPYSYISGSGTNARIYYPWRYISENTLPSQSSMIRGLSTGIVFTVQLCDGSGQPIDESKLKPYQDPEEPGEDSLDEAKYPYGDWITKKSDGSLVLKAGEGTREITKDETKDGYFLHYYYFLRHNNSSTNRENALPMKFGVVRNNIYRVCVAGFQGIPQPFDPGDPDEPMDNYAIMIELDVLAWARHNITVTF